MNWALGTAAAALASVTAYVITTWLSANGPRGGSVMGLIFGSVAASIFLFECLLSFRKRFPRYLSGRVQTWLRGHIWLGLLSVPLVLMHSGFRWGSGLAGGLMWLITIVVSSGVMGFALQNYLPRRMQELVERETVYDQIPRVIDGLRVEADQRMQLVTESSEAGVTSKVKQTLHTRYEQEIRPYLQDRVPASANRLFRTPALIQAYFGHLSTMLPSPLHEALSEIESICEERRQLVVQRRLHLWLHGWLFVHVPLSFALLVLTLAHAVLALRY